MIGIPSLQWMKNKSHGWKYFLIALIALNIVSYSPLLLIVIFEQLGILRGVGALALVGLLLALNTYVLFHLSIINIIYSSVFLIKHRPQGKYKIIIYVFWAVSVCLAIF
jgi:hypothetical protein